MPATRGTGARAHGWTSKKIKQANAMMKAQHSVKMCDNCNNFLSRYHYDRYKGLCPDCQRAIQ